MTVKELKKRLKDMDNELDVKITSPYWGNPMEIFQTYRDKSENICYIEINEYGI